MTSLFPITTQLLRKSQHKQLPMIRAHTYDSTHVNPDFEVVLIIIASREDIGSAMHEKFKLAIEYLIGLDTEVRLRCLPPIWFFLTQKYTCQGYVHNFDR